MGEFVEFLVVKLVEQTMFLKFLQFKSVAS
jgi:hypothetical protein